MTTPIESTPAPRLRSAVTAVALIALVLCVASGPLRAPGGFVRANAIDFLAVYCGAAVAGRGVDPYRVEPLRTCEHRVAPPAKADRWTVVPAPLPSYTLLMLRPLTALPFETAKALWILLGVMSLLVASYCAARICELPSLAVLGLFAPAVGLLNLYFGEPIPLAIACIGIAALCAHRGKAAGAGVFAALALLEPHVGLGACVGAFAALPRARVALLTTGALLAVAGIAHLGLDLNAEYLKAVLPAQARSEIDVNYQLGLTHVLVLAGVGGSAALALGSASYAAMLGLGVFAGRAFAARSAAPAAAIYLPVTFTMLGGAYIHTPEIAAALPGVLLTCTSLRGPGRAVAAVALALLIVPWNAGAPSLVPMLLSLASVFAAIVLVGAGTRASVVVGTAVALALGFYLLALPAPNAVSHARPARPDAIAPRDLASTDWAMLVASAHWMSDEDARRMLLKAPQWLGLLLAVGSACAALPSLRAVTPALRFRGREPSGASTQPP